MAACECGPWSVVHDHQGPPTLRVHGYCRVGEAGTTVTLRVHEPPGFDPKDLLLDIDHTPPADGLPQIHEVAVLFELATEIEYDSVSIVDCEAGIPVHDVH
jgi:hypothetical protein